MSVRSFHLYWKRLFRATAHRETSRKSLRAQPAVEILEDRFALDVASAGITGIHARDLRFFGGPVLTGSSVRIGMVENARPASVTVPDSAKFIHADVSPEAVFIVNNPAKRDKNLDPHAEGVAGVMIANGPAGFVNDGVAPDASLIASADTDPKLSVPVDSILSIEKVVTVGKTTPGEPVSAINLSFGVEANIVRGGIPSSDLTTYLDYSARADNIV